MNGVCEKLGGKRHNPLIKYIVYKRTLGGQRRGVEEVGGKRLLTFNGERKKRESQKGRNKKLVKFKY